MGHIRIGRLPKTRQFAGVFDALGSDRIDAPEIAKATAIAARQQFSQLARDEAINYCFWVLVRIASASRSQNFAGELNEIGIKADRVTSGLSFVQQVSRAVEEGLRDRGQTSVFVQMAALSLREVLSGNIIEKSNTLFGSDFKDVQAACRAISTKKNFGKVAKEFYSNFISRSLRYITDKEISNYVGPGKSVSSPHQVIEFHHALDRYCLESSRIVEEFAGGWYSKNNFETNNNISEDLARGFTSYALEKIQMEIREGKK